MQPVKAIRATVVFFEGLEVDGYRMPNGEFRVGAPDASRVVGYGRNWLTNVLRRGGSTYKALLGLGFSEKIQKVIARTKDEEQASYGLWNSWDDERSELDIDL